MKLAFKLLPISVVVCTVTETNPSLLLKSLAIVTNVKSMKGLTYS